MGRRRRRRRRSVNKPEASAPAPVARPIARPTQRPSANLTSTQDALQRLRANRPDFMKPRPMTNQGAIANNMTQSAQVQSASQAARRQLQGMSPRRPTGKGGAIPTPRPMGGLGKGGQRPAPRPNIEMTNSGVPGAGTPPRPQRPGGKGAVQSAGRAISSKGGQRPSPSMGRPNPYVGNYAPQPAPNVSVEKIPMPPGADENMAVPMTKKAPAFKMRSGNSTTFKEMGSGKKKSAPVKKTGKGYKMPGFGKR